MRGKRDIDYREAFSATMEALTHGGALLVSVDESGRSSGMTFGWGTIGRVWGRDIFTVFVRPSRHTFRLVESAGDFTVNILPAELGQALNHWGRVSGRTADKWAESGLRPAPARLVRSPIVEQGILHFECRVIHRHDMVPDNLLPDILPAYYPLGDFHRVYHGEIVACYGA